MFYKLALMGDSVACLGSQEFCAFEKVIALVIERAGYSVLPVS